MLAEVLGQRGPVLVPDGRGSVSARFGRGRAAVTMQLGFLLGL